MIHKYTWRRRDERSGQKSIVNYIAVDGILRKTMLDAKAVRGIFQGPDHYVVLGKIKIKARWEYGRKNGKGK